MILLYWILSPGKSISEELEKLLCNTKGQWFIKVGWYYPCSMELYQRQVWFTLIILKWSGIRNCNFVARIVLSSNQIATKCLFMDSIYATFSSTLKPAHRVLSKFYILWFYALFPDINYKTVAVMAWSPADQYTLLPYFKTVAHPPVPLYLPIPISSSPLSEIVFVLRLNFATICSSVSCHDKYILIYLIVYFLCHEYNKDIYHQYYLLNVVLTQELVW